VNARILIIDDDADTVEMLKRFVSEQASEIRGLTQSRDAVEEFLKFEPDIVLMDLHMPEPDGLEILRRLQGVRDRIGFVPVVVLTGDRARVARNSALILGADDFLTKPLDRSEVVLRVRNLLRTRRLMVELAETRDAAGGAEGQPL
jgi:putative two-component system response regulator